jgi:hypothetical protein
LALL